MKGGHPMAQEDFGSKASINVTINILAVLFIIAMAALVWSPLRSSPALLDNPYIAVLQFDRVGRDQEQNNLIDSIDENIIKGLSNTNGVFVKRIQPQDQEKRSSRLRKYFNYKGSLGRIKQIAEEQGVRYILTGKVHKYGDNLRQTTKLIDAVTGDLLLIKQFKHSIGEFSFLKNAVADKIVDEIAVELVALNESCNGTHC